MRLPRFFQLRQDLAEQPFAVSFVQENYGWALLTVTLGGQTAEIDLSDVFPPFRDLIEWLKRIGDGEPASAFEIDEEGPTKRLEVLATDDPQRLLFIIKENYRETIHIQGIVDRDRLQGTFKAALFDFFRNNFSAERWDGDGPESSERMRQDILADPWFRGSPE